MSILETLPIIGRWFDKGLDLADQAITDTDKQNELIAHLSEGKGLIDQELHLRELSIKTIPWVDALHKMGRQLLNFITIIAVFILLLLDLDIDGPTAAVLGGPNMVYQYVKKVGK